jgi:galactokinase
VTETVIAAFRSEVGREPEGVWSAPGRVNLIGEHTDYNEGFALPFALPLRTAVAAARRADGMLLVRSCQQSGPEVRVPVATLAPGAVRGWAAYVVGVVWALQAAGHPVGGLDLFVDGGVPAGSGLSSSAAIECAVALAVADLYDLSIEPAALAGLAQYAENAFVGVPCGPMDQTVSMLATSGHAMFFDTRFGTVEHIPFDPTAARCRLLVIDTHSTHAHAGGEYAERRRACAMAAERLEVPALRDITEDRLEAALRALADSPVLARRVRHIVTENGRTVRVAALLRAGAASGIGPLLTASHRSLRDDFAVSSPPLDAVVDAACDAGALGARLTGGGFGGCAIALVTDERASIVMDAVVAAAIDRGFAAPTSIPGTPSAGTHKETGLTVPVR